MGKPKSSFAGAKKVREVFKQLDQQPSTLNQRIKKRPILQQKQFQPNPFGRTSTGSRV
jgi:hypothetical protein